MTGGERAFLLPVVGVPGVGKSTVASILAEELGCAHLEVSEVARRVGVVAEDPTGRATEVIVDFSPVTRFVRGALGERCVVLASHIVDPVVTSLLDYVPVIVVLRLHPRVLKERLEGRGWPRGKVAENVLAEALGVLWDELQGLEHMCIEVDVTGLEPAASVSAVWRALEEWRVGRRIDWLEYEEVVELASRLSAVLDLEEYGFG